MPLVQMVTLKVRRQRFDFLSCTEPCLLLAWALSRRLVSIKNDKAAMLYPPWKQKVIKEQVKTSTKAGEMKIPYSMLGSLYQRTSSSSSFSNLYRVPLILEVRCLYPLLAALLEVNGKTAVARRHHISDMSKRIKR